MHIGCAYMISGFELSTISEMPINKASRFSGCVHSGRLLYNPRLGGRKKRARLIAGLKLKSLFHVVQHLHPGRMPAAFKGGGEPGLNNHFGQFNADHPSSDRQNIGVVVLPGELCGVGLAADYSPNALYLVGCNGNPHTGAAEEESLFAFAAGYRPGNLLSEYGVVHPLGRIGSEVFVLVSLFFQKLLNLFLELIRSMIAADCYHLSPPVLVIYPCLNGI